MNFSLPCSHPSVCQSCHCPPAPLLRAKQYKIKERHCGGQTKGSHKKGFFFRGTDTKREGDWEGRDTKKKYLL